ncbi:MAG: EAL domain-containing protein, partial [Gammaproteobacteria bacterium]|nr:EAL domain-containing protein [Gammaproteobacteria bacterium]
QQQQWIKDGQDYTIAVNISARNLIDNRLVKLLKVLLEKFDADPSKIELEITETAIMHDAYKSTEYLTQISDLGIKLSIDDFGTGYSSLAYLRNLPINKLKLDRSFIMDMLKSADRAYIVETIIKLAKALELEVIAEGVEDEVTLNNLKKMQCDTAQGYFICKPNNWDEIEHWLKRRTKMV